MTDQWYCPMPFKHAFVDSTGVSPCCMIRRQPTDLDQWAKNEYLLEIQHDTLAGKVPRDCQGCHEAEQAGAVSLRQHYLKDYNYDRFSTLDIDFIDYRYSNLCNFKCRSCSPDFSHQISQELRVHPDLGEFFHVTSENKLQKMAVTNADWILKNLHKIQRLMFTGGEPTVIPEVRMILEKLLQSPSYTTKILITSNGSFTDTFWLDLTEKLPDRLHWTISLDAVTEAATIIRHGTDWEQVAKNVTWLAKNAESLDVNTVISCLNVMQLKPLLQFCCDLRMMSKYPSGKHGDDGIRHQFSIATQSIISALNWPDHLKPKIKEYLQDCLTLPLDAEQQITLSSLIDSIENKVFDQSGWDKSRAYHLRLDQIRQEDHTSLLS